MLLLVTPRGPEKAFLKLILFLPHAGGICSGFKPLQLLLNFDTAAECIAALRGTKAARTPIDAVELGRDELEGGTPADRSAAASAAPRTCCAVWLTNNSLASMREAQAHE